MGTIKKKVFLGKYEVYNQKLAYLARIAQKEPWSFKSTADEDPYRILRNYFQFTYDRLDEENKIVLSEDQQYACMNTGLLTQYDQEIMALFSRSQQPDFLPWYLVGFYRDTDKFFKERFSKVPEMADYFDDIGDVIYDKNLKIELNINHIIDDNLERFQQAGYDNTELIHALLTAAMEKVKKKLRRNFKLALPFYYHNRETDERKIQLLIPLYFPGANVRLALVLDKIKDTQRDPYYLAITVLPVEWAYMNSRIIVRPDEEWAKIIEEVNVVNEKINLS